MASENEIIEKIKSYKENNNPNFKKFMSFYKTKFPDFYESKLKELLNETKKIEVKIEKKVESSKKIEKKDEIKNTKVINNNDVIMNNQKELRKDSKNSLSMRPSLL